jgi:hypothetical protein
MRYPDRLTLTRKAGPDGSTNQSSGVFTPPPVTLVYEGPADVQDLLGKPRGSVGEPLGLPPGIAYLPRWRARALGAMRLNDDVVAQMANGFQRVGVVDSIRPIDDSLVVRWLK